MRMKSSTKAVLPYFQFVQKITKPLYLMLFSTIKWDKFYGCFNNFWSSQNLQNNNLYKKHEAAAFSFRAR